MNERSYPTASGRSRPDLDVLARLLLDRDSLSTGDRFLVMRMMFGGHVDRYDYHQVGLNEEFPRTFLRGAGYVNIRRVDDLGVFDDTSRMVFAGVAISLSMIADRPDQSQFRQPAAGGRRAETILAPAAAVSATSTATASWSDGRAFLVSASNIGGGV